ncbi:hypothetical protein ACWCY6_27695 [Streptomyces sp. 900105755]
MGRAELRDSAPLLHEISRYGWLGVEFADRVRWRRPVTAGALTYPFYLVHRLVERRLGRRLRQRLTLDMRPRDLSARPPLTRTR